MTVCACADVCGHMCAHAQFHVYSWRIWAMLWLRLASYCGRLDSLPAHVVFVVDKAALGEGVL